MALRIRKEWRPVSGYADLDDFGNRLRNQEALRRFLADFGWLEYMFNPEAYDFRKFLAGDEAWREQPRDGIGFARLKDPSLAELGGYARAFRDRDSVMISVTGERLDGKAVEAWAKSHRCDMAWCDPSRSFRGNGSARMALFMLPIVRKRFRDRLEEYGTPVDLFAKDIYGKSREDEGIRVELSKRDPG